MRTAQRIISTAAALYIALLLVIILSYATADDAAAGAGAANGTQTPATSSDGTLTGNNDAASNNTCQPIVGTPPAITRVTFSHDCVVIGSGSNDSLVVVTHYITDQQTANYPGEFSMAFTGDWGDGSTKISEVRSGYIGGQNHTTEWNHTYTQAGNDSIKFGFGTVQQAGGANLACLGLVNEDSRVSSIQVVNAGPGACVVPLGDSSSSRERYGGFVLVPVSVALVSAFFGILGLLS